MAPTPPSGTAGAGTPSTSSIPTGPATTVMSSGSRAVGDERLPVAPAATRPGGGLRSVPQRDEHGEAGEPDADRGDGGQPGPFADGVPAAAPPQLSTPGVQVDHGSRRLLGGPGQGRHR